MPITSLDGTDTLADLSVSCTVFDEPGGTYEFVERVRPRLSALQSNDVMQLSQRSRRVRTDS